MRDLLLSLATLSLVMPSAALAEDCPTKITPELVTALGEPVAWLDAGQTVHRPSGVTMLGLPVSYVVAIKAPGEEAIEELAYRFDGVMRKYSERYPLDVRKAFDEAYPGARCGSDQVTSCAIAFQSSSGAAGLAGVSIGEGDVYLSDDARGDGLSLVQADYAEPDSGPVFLVCLYDTGG